MPTVRMLTWNVESLGAEKAFSKQTGQPTEIVNLLGLVITGAGAHIVGIMEIKGGIGPRLMLALLAVLNNLRPPSPPYTWQGRLSSRQDGGTQEQTLFLWQEGAALTLDPIGQPGPTSSIGIADSNLFEGLGAQQQPPWTPADVAQLLGALQDNGYLRRGQFKRSSRMITTTTMRIDPTGWTALHGALPNPAVTFAASPKMQPPPGVGTVAQRKDLADRLLSVDILRFVTYGDRSPYLANFRLGGKSLMICLLHAPGPGEFPGDAINVMGLSRPMAAQTLVGNLLVTGDFNIPANRMAIKCPVYGRNPVAGVAQFGPRTPKQYATVFSPVIGTPLNAADLMPGAPTSLTNRYLPDASPPGLPLVSAYDKFFFHGGASPAVAITAANARALNVVQTIAANQPTFQPGVAVSALTYFRAYRGSAFMTKQTTSLTKKHVAAQKDVNRAQGYLNKIPLPHPPAAGSANSDRFVWRSQLLAEAQADLATVATSLANIGVVTTLVGNPAQVVPTGIGTALPVYRFAVSDHLPITVDLTA